MSGWKLVNNKQHMAKTQKPQQQTQQQQNICYTLQPTLNSRNEKRILCQNMIMHGKCNYGNKCVFAHNLDEQNVDEMRKQAYSMIKESKDLSNIILKKNYYLYKTLLELTKICENCSKHTCTGGYNCTHGACLEKYVICSKDLNYGTCKGHIDEPKCMYIHLTDKGLKPYNTINRFDIKPTIQQYEIPKASEMMLSLDYFKKFTMIYKTNTSNDNNEVDSMSDMFGDVEEDKKDDDTISDDNDCNISIFS